MNGSTMSAVTDLALGTLVSVVALCTMVTPSPRHRYRNLGPLDWVIVVWLGLAFSVFNSTLIWLARWWLFG